jgi:hypothetical protein
MFHDHALGGAYFENRREDDGCGTQLLSRWLHALLLVYRASEAYV